MIAANNFGQLEFRERLTEAILEMLADLPETQRNIFVWNHYLGCDAKRIAEILGASLSEVESTLDVLNSFLCRKTRGLLAIDPQVDLENSLPTRDLRNSQEGCRFGQSSFDILMEASR